MLTCIRDESSTSVDRHVPGYDEVGDTWCYLLVDVDLQTHLVVED